MTKPLTLLLMPVLILGACGSRENEASGTSTTAADDSAAATTMASPDASGAVAGAGVPLTGQAFAIAMAASDRFELESARTVQSAGATGAVREFAQMMIMDHQTSTNNLRETIGQVEQRKLDASPEMTAEQNSMLADLKASPNDKVAALYARQQVAAHERALAMLQAYSLSGDTKPLMDFAGKTAQVVSQHLEHARRLP